MVVSVIVQYTRRPDISPDEFKRYMEEQQVPLIKEALGLHFPASFPRRYVARAESGVGDRLGLQKHGDPTAPVVLIRLPEELGWDMWGEMIFRDDLHMRQCLEAMNSVGGQRVKDDEENFTLSYSLKVVLVGEHGAG